MSIKIGLISDPHATAAPVADALRIFRAQQVECIICAGDIAGYGNELDETVRLLIENHCLCIKGNHEEWDYSSPLKNLEKETDKKVLGEAESWKYLASLPRTRQMMFEGVNLLVVHASPPDALTGGIRLLDKDGQMIAEQKQYWSDYLHKFDFDVLVVGHTHQVFACELGGKLVINPGSSTFNHSCAILKLPEKSVKLYSLGNQTIRSSWNWGMESQLQGRQST